MKKEIINTRVMTPKPQKQRKKLSHSFTFIVPQKPKIVVFCGGSKNNEIKKVTYGGKVIFPLPVKKKP